VTIHVIDLLEVVDVYHCEIEIFFRREERMELLQRVTPIG